MNFSRLDTLELDVAINAPLLMSSHYFPADARRSSGLPKYSSLSSSAVREKLGPRSHGPWFINYYFRIPFSERRRLRVFIPNVPLLHSLFTRRLGRVLGSLVFLLIIAILVFLTCTVSSSLGGERPSTISAVFSKPSTLVYEKEDIQRIWQWEIASGHYPSRHAIPEQVEFLIPPRNPGVPYQRSTTPRASGSYANETRGIGATRQYFHVTAPARQVAYPPRPVSGSIADLDMVMDHCDFDAKKYVRDCLEVLRVGAGLDSHNNITREVPDDWKYIYTENADSKYTKHPLDLEISLETSGIRKNDRMEVPPIKIPAPRIHTPYSMLPEPCDEENPRIFHMFWAGPFTDKPYTALLSFLFTQNTGLHNPGPPDDTVCRPQFWMWINPGPAASVPNPSAVRDMFTELKGNPWASPFLHPRFKDTIKFKLWNTTEQLDSIPELKDEWRHQKNMFNSGGRVYKVPEKKKEEEGGTTETHKKDQVNRVGSKSYDEYDRMSVILSDMARFVLCHRFGGIYLDADTLFLRDWEELWGWKGAFAYRWSRLRSYNTAVLRMHKGSALGTFLFRTALKNGLDFHPETITYYVRDANIEELLLRLPDALFDPAWLNTEYYQRDRPPQPYFVAFSELFKTPPQASAAPHAMGFDGFFKGAYSYHFHNGWWEAFDPRRNWPDLGSRFIAGELLAKSELNETAANGHKEHERDLSWATVLKRTFESYIRGERPNMYGEWLEW